LLFSSAIFFHNLVSHLLDSQTPFTTLLPSSLSVSSSKKKRDRREEEEKSVVELAWSSFGT
jgi:hypothetical protein